MRFVLSIFMLISLPVRAEHSMDQSSVSNSREWGDRKDDLVFVEQDERSRARRLADELLGEDTPRKPAETFDTQPSEK